MKPQYVGLTDSEVLRSREAHGSNVLTPPQRESLWRKFLQKFKDPLIIILLVAGALSILISCYEYFVLGSGVRVFFEPVGIFAAIILATGLAFYFEAKAEREFNLLNLVSDEVPVRVLRNGTITQVPRKDIVVGDIVLLAAGEEIPADADLLEATDLHADESTLTGEPVCRKSADPADADPDATYPTNRVLRGTKVMEGHGVGRVVAVGDSTENGKVFTAVQIDRSVKTPLSLQLDRLGNLIARLSYVVAGVVFVGHLLVCILHNPDASPVQYVSYVLESLMIAVTLIVLAVPEGLPMAITLSLAYSMRRMLRTNNLVRKMHACETMGAATVICTDKTGTLTQNRMLVSEMLVADGADDALFAEGIAANSTAHLDFSNADAPQAVGNPTEGALLLWLWGKGQDYRTLRRAAQTLSELPFSTERKFMATLVRSAAAAGKRMLYVKGAPEIICRMCDLDASGFQAADVREKLEAWQNRAMRTLAFAMVEIPDETADFDLKNPKNFVNLRLQGIAAIADPVRSDVPAAVAECLRAGIAVKIVTGDTPGTAREIARQIGLWTDADADRAIITGPEFAALTDSELDERVGELKIIARARPMDKKRLVEALQRCGEVVAVTGDGTNDAPALKAAQVGLAMGDGTSVAKEAGDITILDNSFASIGKAVMWGRSLYRNIQRFILFQLTVNVVACAVLLIGSFMGIQSPLTVTQMLWVNLIMDTFAAMALASLPPSKDVMRERPRSPKAFIISTPMRKFILGVGGVMAVALLLLLNVLEHREIGGFTDIFAQFGHALDVPGQGAKLMSPYETCLFFTIFVLLNFWNLFNAKAFLTGHSALRLKQCGEFLLIAAIILVGQVLIVEFGGDVFRTTPLPLSDWAWALGSTFIVLLIGEMARLLKRLRKRGGSRD